MHKISTTEPLPLQHQCKKLLDTHVEGATPWSILHATWSNLPYNLEAKWTTWYLLVINIFYLFLGVHVVDMLLPFPDKYINDQILDVGM